MSLSQAWDRMFWSVMITIFVGLLWMKFLQETAACESIGLVVAISVGIAFFSSGWYQANRQKKRDSQTASDAAQIPEDLL
ncbi:MAG: hypothetical protein F9K27_02825 [Anaerolineae bacterium]|nr:MAG: hypothetical protein F9K27_02825 [Anaerolineae bacterium]